MRRLGCWALGRWLAESALAGEPAPALAAGHAATCLACQARISRARLLGRELRRLRSHPAPAPARLMGGVMFNLDRAPNRRTTAWIPAAAVVTATATAVALVLLRRRPLPIG